MTAERKWKHRAEKLRKRKHGMRVSGRSVFTIQAVQKKKAEVAKKTKAKKTSARRSNIKKKAS